MLVWYPVYPVLLRPEPRLQMSWNIWMCLISLTSPDYQSLQEEIQVSFQEMVLANCFLSSQMGPINLISQTSWLTRTRIGCSTTKVERLPNHVVLEELPNLPGPPQICHILPRFPLGEICKVYTTLFHRSSISQKEICTESGESAPEYSIVYLWLA